MPGDSSPLIPTDPCQMAELLQRALERQGVAADVHDGYGLALVSVWAGLVVWCNGERFWWRAGWDVRRARPVYASNPVSETDRAAHRIAARCAELRQAHQPEPTVNTPGDPV